MEVAVTEGLERRPRVPLELKLSPVEEVELLAEDECRLSSGADFGEGLRVSTC